MIRDPGIDIARKIEQIIVAEIGDKVSLDYIEEEVRHGAYKAAWRIIDEVINQENEPEPQPNTLLGYMLSRLNLKLIQE